MGKYAALAVLAHPLLQMYIYTRNWLWLVTPSLANEFEEYVTFGRAALFLFVAVWILSAVFRKRLPYRLWRYSHYLTYPLLSFVFIHALEIGTYLNSFPLVKSWWFVMTALFYATLVSRLVDGAGVGRARYVLSKREMVGDTIALLTFMPKGKHISPAIGQYAFIQKRRFGESHPYTVMEADKETGALTLGVKDVGRFSQALQKLEVGTRVRFDGPYGVFTREAQNAEPKVVIAGGIGITPFVRLLQTYGRNSLFLYANRVKADFVRREELRKSVGNGYYEIINQESGVSDAHTHYGKLDEPLLKEIVGQSYANLKYFVCGSPGFISGFEGMLERMGVPRNRIFYESLGY